jgi:acetylornithine/N-succinyldiaminopimelate aminotransferase
MSIKEIYEEYVAHTYARFPIELVSGEGSILRDAQGKEYIDMGSGIAVNTFGIGDKAWKEAVIAQLDKLQHTSNLYYTQPGGQLAQMLCERTGLRRVFFSNSGAEANECAIKAARKYGALHKGSDYTTVITLKNSFHGRTITTLAATGQDVFHQQFQPLTPGFDYAEANNLDDVRAKVRSNKTAAILFEVVQGEGGVNPLTPEFVHGLKELAEQEDLLLMADEVQVGNGRSGQLYGYMNYDIVPDVVSTAKGLGGGLPLGATLLGEKVKDVYGPGDHGSTFGGNPVCCAGAISILERLDEELLAQVRKKSDYIKTQLTGAPGVKSVTGLGLMLGVETERDAGEVLQQCMDQGVLVLRAKNKVRLLPALNIPDELLAQAVEILKSACNA